jgi:hypothetical protein
MRRIVLLVVVAMIMAAITVAAGPVFAEDLENGHNCNGAFIRVVTPGVVNHGQQGPAASAEAQTGTRGENVREGIATRANCGNNP